MQKVLTAAQMREVDRLTTERYGIPSIILMENAAHAVARVITEKLGGSVKGKSILILCGKGNNGGDGAALARILWEYEAFVSVVLIGKIDDTKGDARINFEFLRNLQKHGSFPSDFSLNYDRGSVSVFEMEDGEYVRKRYRPHHDPEIVVDALLGTGTNRPADRNLSEVIVSPWFDDPEFREKSFHVISIDLPSGLEADNGSLIGSTIKADMTVTFTAPKLANLIGEARSNNGSLVIANIGTPQELINEQSSSLYLTERDDAESWLYAADFDHDSYKNKRGHALVIAGSETYSGAAVLSGNSAMRSGVGLVTLACPAEAKTEIASRLLPEVILTTIDSSELDELSPKANAVAIGPGLSATDPIVAALVKSLISERTRPTVVDAGALSFLNPPDGIPQVEGVPLILTPHEGEFMRLLGTDDKAVIEDRVAAVRKFSQENNVILVLKGERVLIGEPGGKVVVNPTGNSGLGKAGNGDTLTGILAGFVSQAAAMKIDIFDTVVAAVYVAGFAGDIAEKKYSKRVMTASDVRECLTDAFNQLNIA